MIKVMFVCLGNICRSPMAECVMSHLIKESNLEDKIEVASSATSFEEIGNPIYPPAPVTKTFFPVKFICAWHLRVFPQITAAAVPKRRHAPPWDNFRYPLFATVSLLRDTVAYSGNCPKAAHDGALGQRLL